MRILLRVIVFLLAGVCLYFGFRLKPDAVRPPAPDSTPVPSGSVVKDLLGASQIRSGQKAKEVLRGVDEQRREEIKETE